eukprot:1182102-Prymnesium_polylepis.1
MPALARHFAIILKRAARPSVGRPMQLAEGAIEIQSLVDDFVQAQLLIDLNVMVLNPVTGEKPLEYKVRTAQRARCTRASRAACLRSRSICVPFDLVAALSARRAVCCPAALCTRGAFQPGAFQPLCPHAARSSTTPLPSLRPWPCADRAVANGPGACVHGGAVER